MAGEPACAMETQILWGATKGKIKLLVAGEPGRFGCLQARLCGRRARLYAEGIESFGARVRARDQAMWPEEQVLWPENQILWGV